MTPPVLGRLALGLTQRLRGSASLTLLREMVETPRLDAAEVRERQFLGVRRMLEHCEARVPYYREVFRDLGTSARDIRKLEDLSQLPVLTKDLVRANELRLLRDDVSRQDLSTHYSGGSTGVPLRFYRDRAYMDVSEAGTFRNFMQCGWAPGEMVAFFWGFDQRLTEMGRLQFEARQYLRRLYQFDPFRSGEADMRTWVRTFRRIRPAIAHGYASTIARFAGYVQRARERVPRLKGVFTTAEKLLPQQRELISTTFDCPVFDCYGSSEVQNIASECSAGRMHVNADFVVLETGGADETEPSPLLVTSLWNYSMPFVRYRNEDVGVLVQGTCECGSAFPLMDLRIARLSDNFPMPGGRVIHGEFFTHLLYGSDGIVQFQFRQTALDRIELDVVPGAGREGERDRALRSAIQAIQEVSGGEVTVDVRLVPDIPLSSAGKHRFTWSQVRMGDTP